MPTAQNDFRNFRSAQTLEGAVWELRYLYEVHRYEIGRYEYLVCRYVGEDGDCPLLAACRRDWLYAIQRFVWAFDETP